METRTPPLRKVILPVGFAFVCALLTIFVFRSFGGALPLEPQKYRVEVPLAQASNVVRGSDVQLAGVDVGRVVEVRRSGNHAVAKLELEPKYAPLRSGVRAIVRTKTLLGEGYIELAPGRATAGPLPDGGRVPADQVQPSVQLDEFLATFSPATRRRMRSLFSGLSRALEGRSRSLNDSLGDAAPLSGNVAEVLDALDRQRGDLRRLFARSADVLEALGGREGELEAAVSAGNEVLDVTARRNRELALTVRELAPFLDQLHDTSRTISGASADLNRAVSALLPVAPLVGPALDEIIAATPGLRGLFRALPGTIAAGNRGLPALPRITRAARRGFRAFYPASRELVPFMQLLAVNRTSPLLAFANVAQVNSGTFVGPGGIVHNYGTGIATIWNETIAGWKRKLPTNRQNPYPKPPDGLLDTGRLGYLKSYDCRNTGNRLYLPPTGTGAPPCVLQGPWEFNGKRRFYPRLELAPP